jgi:sugar lactone lactonase YvrE/acetyl esterase/lipase
MRLWLSPILLALAGLPAGAQTALNTFLDHPVGIAFDRAGRLLVSEQRGHRVLRVDLRTGQVAVVAGTGEIGSSGDGGPATSARLNYPDIAVAPNGDLIIGEIDGYRIRRVNSEGLITTIAGTGQQGYSGDGGPARQARITRPFDIEVDTAGNIYFTDTEVHRIRRIDARTAVITTVAGNGSWGFSGDGGPATAAALARPHVLLLAPDGDLIIGDSFNQRIRRVDATTGVIVTIAGNGTFGSAGDGGPALDASFAYFGDFVLRPNGDLIISGVGDHRLRRIDARTGVISAFAGTGRWTFGGDNGPAHAASFHLTSGMDTDRNGHIYIADKYNGRVRRIDTRTRAVTTVAGARAPQDYPGAFHNHYDRARIEREVHAPLALAVAGSPGVRVRANLDFLETHHPRKRVDLYLPPETTTPAPLVVLVHTASRSDLDIAPNSWNSNVTRARALAAAGLAAAVFNHEMRFYPMRPREPAADLQRVIDYLRRKAGELSLDPSRVCVVAYGDGAPLLSPILEQPPAYLKCLAMFYPLLDIREPRFVAADEPDEVKSSFSPLIQLYRAGAAVPPLLLIYGGQDNPDAVADAQRFERVARSLQARIDVLVHAEASAGFDVAAPDATTVRILRDWISFLQRHLSRPSL